MVIKIKDIAVIFCLLSTLLLPACRDEDGHSEPVETGDTAYQMLYQKSDSVTEALKFIETPEDRLVACLSSVRSRGNLANQEQLKFANKLFGIRKSKDTDAFISLLSNASRAQLYDDNDKNMLRYYISLIEDGSFVYGQSDVKFFATMREYTEKDDEKLMKHISFAEKPTDIITYYHFNRPQYMLIGTTLYLLKEKDSYKLVTETLLTGRIPAVSKAGKSPEEENYGIVSHQYIEDAYDKMNVWKYQWKVELSGEETIANQFEIVMLTEVVSGQEELIADITQKKLVKADTFEKHKDQRLNFRFRIGDKEPKDNPDMSGTDWSFGFSIASMGLSSNMHFTGTGITNVKVRKDGGFIGPYLEFMSFETSKDSVAYKHRIVLHKTPTDSKEKPAN